MGMEVLYQVARSREMRCEVPIRPCTNIGAWCPNNGTLYDDSMAQGVGVSTEAVRPFAACLYAFQKSLKISVEPVRLSRHQRITRRIILDYVFFDIHNVDYQGCSAMGKSISDQRK